LFWEEKDRERERVEEAKRYRKSMTKQSSFLASSIDNGIGAIVSPNPREQDEEEGGGINWNEVGEFWYSVTDCAQGYVKYTV